MGDNSGVLDLLAATVPAPVWGVVMGVGVTLALRSEELRLCVRLKNCAALLVSLLPSHRLLKKARLSASDNDEGSAEVVGSGGRVRSLR